MNTESNFQRVITKVVIDVICLLAVGLPILIFHLSGKPYERGFFCDDESLRHPFKKSTIPSWLLYLVGLGLPIIVIFIVEWTIYLRILRFQKKIQIMSIRIPYWIYKCYCNIGIFGFGAACSQLITDVAKYTIGRLRPHFFDICHPDIDCNDAKYKFVYVDTYVCQQKNKNLLKAMRLSFPSGHSSFSAYCMIFLIMYLQTKMTWSGSKLLKHFLQFICLILTLYTSLSRISDYKHHWSDVLAGFLQGALVAIIIVMFVSDLLAEQQSRVNDESQTQKTTVENELSMH